MAKQILERIEKAEDELQETKEQIKLQRLTYTLTRLSDKPTVQFYFDGISKHDFEKIGDYKPKLQGHFERLGYEVKRELSKRQKQVFNPLTHEIDKIDYDYYSFFFYLNRDALISSLKHGELSKKGYTWQGNEQVKIEKGRKKNGIDLLDEKGDILRFASLNEFAKTFQGTARGAREAMKKGDGETFCFKGKHFWIVQDDLPK